MGQIPQLSSVKAGAISFHKFDLDFAVDITKITQNVVDLTNKTMHVSYLKYRPCRRNHWK